jgi:hypothetical protein
MGRQPGDGYWDLILILWAAIISRLAIRTVGRRSRVVPLAEADAEAAALQLAGGNSGSASIRRGEKGHEGGRGVAGLAA